ncbi:hypothetical protein [Aliiroseovarius sediminis]|uniref:hypothetical protein n=1 Tax=Aliiroseovarius sediminis TaxID=2925839 RepID=UPI001F5A768D|nr:hypothetical protein [Aliiroseovarius sediminis]MCI2392881.1 hypothetical protein [Aliiroseovarius sediminis]
MTKPHPNLQIDLRHYHYLGEAFFRVGLSLFPDDWTGREQFAVPDFTGEQIEQERAALEKNVSRLRQQELELAMTPTDGLSDKEYVAFRENKAATRDRRMVAEQKLFSLGKPDHYQHQENAAYQRRMDAEATLITAFKAKELDLITYGGLVVDWSTWPDRKGWDYSFPYSTINAPPSISSMGCAIALVRRTAFEYWHQQQPFFQNALRELSDEERALVWMKELVSTNPTPQKKDSILADMKSEYPELSERAQKRIWDAAAPEAWKLSGPKRPA